MRRVLVIGPGGAGKSTFAQRLGEILKIEVKHLDAFYWRSGWRKPSEEEWLKTVAEVERFLASQISETRECLTQPN